MYDASDVIECITGKKAVSAPVPVVKREAEKPEIQADISEAEIASAMEHLNIFADDVREEKASDDDFELPNDLTEQQRRISEELLSGAMHADELAARLEIDSSELMTELTELEIFGIVRSLPGKMYELIR